MALQLTQAQVPIQVLRGQVLVQAHQGQLADLQVQLPGGQRVRLPMGKLLQERVGPSGFKTP